MKDYLDQPILSLWYCTNVSEKKIRTVSSAKRECQTQRTGSRDMRRPPRIHFLSFVYIIKAK